MARGRRIKIPIEKIQDTKKRDVAFSKRRRGLLKKAFELSVLCDVDVALIVISPAGRMYCFSHNNSLEDILIKCLNQIPSGLIEDRESLLVSLENMKIQDVMMAGASSQQQVENQSTGNAVEDIDSELIKCQEQLEALKGLQSNLEDMLIEDLNQPADQVPSSLIKDKESLPVSLENMKSQDNMMAGASSQQQVENQSTGNAVEDIDSELIKCLERLEAMEGPQRSL